MSMFERRKLSLWYLGIWYLRRKDESVLHSVLLCESILWNVRGISNDKSEYEVLEASWERECILTTAEHSQGMCGSSSFLVG